MKSGSLRLRCCLGYCGRHCSASSISPKGGASSNASSREVLDGGVRLLNEAGVAEAVQQPGALHYLGEVVYAQGITRAFQDGFWILAIVYLRALIPAWILSQTRRR